MNPVVTPPMRKGKVPPFHEIGDLPFQDFCRDLLADLGHYKECRVFGVRGQKQYGIDIRCVNNDGILEVAQCKCYRVCTEAHIKQASDEFLTYVEDWRSKGVRRFILIVACPVETTQAIDQKDIETKRFEEYGIQYEVWDAMDLRDLLRELPKVVATHIHPADYWVKELCGDQYKSAFDSQNSYGINLVANTLIDNLNQLSALFTSKASRELEDKRELYRQGRVKEVTDWIDALRGNEAEWLAISPETRGSILRLEAIVNIDCYENYSKAEELLRDAKEIDPNGFDQRVQSLLTLHKDGPQDALEIISDAQDADSICLQASLLLQLGRHKEAISILESLQSQNNAEIFRLLALAYLDDRNLELAIETISQAKAIKSQWESIQIADAVISYFSALSPVVFRETHFIWPVPIELDLVKSTNGSINSLEHAAEVFNKVSINEQRREDFRLTLRIWYAASLACDFRKQSEAEKEFSDLLVENPSDHRLISWVLSRRYAINLNRSRQELKILRESGSITSANIVSSVMLDIHEKRTRNTLHLIERSRTKLIKEENEQLVDYWSVQVLIARKMFSKARKRLEASNYRLELEPLQLLLLKQEANASKNFQPYVDYLLNLVETTQDALLLLELCHFYAFQQQWSNLATYSGRLVTEIQTVDALKIGAAAFYNSGHYRDCKELIEKFKHLCFGNTIPSDLILIYFRSKALSGEFPEALTDLRQLTESNPTKQNLLLLRDFYIQMGDKAGVRYITTLAKEQANLQPDELILFATPLLWASRDLAKELIRMAPSDKLSSEQLVEKMTLGFSLGLDNEIKDIHNFLPQITQEIDARIKVLTLEETIEIVNQSNQHRDEQFSLYSNGELPIHFLSKNAGFNLFAFYKKIIRNNIDNSTLASQKIPLYIRYGGKPSLTDFKEPELPFELNRFALDVTSLLLLDHFSLLEVFEEIGDPIKIPQDAVRALVNMQLRFEQYQPEIIQASQLISEYLNEHKVNELKTIPIPYSKDYDFDHLRNLISSIDNHKGFVVGFITQLSSWNRLDFKEKDLFFITSTDIIDSLRTEGIITEVERSNALDQLGTEGQLKTNTFVPVGSNLFFIANTISQLAQTSIFGHVCNTYIVWIESSEISNIHSSIKEERDRSGFSASLQNLIDRISRGLEDKKYRFLPHQKHESEVESRTQDDILLRNLLDSILSGQDSHVLPAIDDFFIQKQLYFQGAQVIGIYELVWSAYKHGLIDKARFFDTLIELRKADLRYIPISSDELFFHIKQAAIENNQISENANLKTLRGYISASFVYGRKPQSPTQPIGCIEAVGEFEYLISFVHSIAYTVTKIWQDDASEDEKQIRSSWIFDNLYLDILTLSQVTGWEREQKDHIFLVALGLSEFFLNGLQFPKSDSSDSLRKEFYNWFYRTICTSRFSANPGLLEKTAEFIKNSLASQISDHIDTDFDPYVRLFSERLYHDLPVPLKAIIDQDKEFLEKIGIEIISVIEIVDIKFAVQNFWEEFTQVLAGKPTTINALEPKGEILFSPYISKKQFGATFTHPVNGQNINVESGDFVFLTNNNLQEWIDRNIEYFSELSRNELEEVSKQISLAASPLEKMELLNELRISSIGNYYHNFREELIVTESLDFGHLLPPSQKSLQEFFGFEPIEITSSTVEDLLNTSARNLESRLGLFTAITRISSFPVEIPAYLLDKIQELSSGERNILFSKLSNTLITPIGRLHFLKITTHYDFGEQATGLIRSFFDEEVDNEIIAFLLLLGWITDELEHVLEKGNYSIEEKLLLSWGHTDQLFSIFKRASVPFDWLTKVFREKKSELPFRYIFSRSPSERDDIAYGGRLGPLPFKILGLMYALKENTSLSKDNQEKLLKEVFPWEENIALPALDLLEDKEVFTNRLHSFFGNDVSNSLRSLISGDDERISTISNSSLKDLASQAIDWLSTPESSAAGWQFLFGIYHTQALPEILLISFDKRVCDFNFVEMVNKNHIIALLGFYFSTCQAQQLSDSAKNHLMSELMGLAEAGSKLSFDLDNSEGHTFQKVETIAMLFEATIQLSKAVPDDRMIDEFSLLIKKIIARWKEAKPIGLRLLNRLYQDLPIPIAHTLGKVLLEVRSLR